MLGHCLSTDFLANKEEGAKNRPLERAGNLLEASGTCVGFEPTLVLNSSNPLLAILEVCQLVSFGAEDQSTIEGVDGLGHCQTEPCGLAVSTDTHESSFLGCILPGFPVNRCARTSSIVFSWQS
jgi:hypothetical protein